LLIEMVGIFSIAESTNGHLLHVIANCELLRKTYAFYLCQPYFYTPGFKVGRS